MNPIYRYLKINESPIPSYLSIDAFNLYKNRNRKIIIASKKFYYDFYLMDFNYYYQDI